MSQSAAERARAFYAQTYDVSVSDWPGEMAFYRELAAQAYSHRRPVLELACGTGRVAIRLAREGVEVVGLDLSPAMLDVAREKSAGMSNLRWVQGDMRSFELGQTFGLVIIPGHAFQNLTAAADQVACLEAIERHLDLNGTLVVHLDHPEVSWLGDLTREKGGAFEAAETFCHPETGRPIRTSRAWSYERSTQTAIMQTLWEEIDADGQVAERWESGPTRLHCVFPFEMEHLLARTGFQVEAVYGSFFQEKLSDQSENMVWVARKRRASEGTGQWRSPDVAPEGGDVADSGTCNLKPDHRSTPAHRRSAMKRQRILMLAGALALGLLLALAVGISLAQEPQQTEGQVGEEGSTGALEITPGAIAIQGRLTDAGGTPLNGTYNVTFRLYEQSTGGTPLCSDTNSVQVTGGLFSSYIDNCYNDVNGQKVWLGIEVGSDGEMTPRQAILAVPYALSLRPSAVISGTTSGRVLNVRNYGSGQGLLGYSKNHDGVYGWSDASNHAGVSGENTSGGIGVYGWSNGGPAIKAAGRIESTAKSYLWISGNGVRPYHQSDSTIIDMDGVGGAFVKRGADAGRKNVMLPITVVAPLYGQDVTVSDLDIYWKGETEFDGLTAVILRRQTGVGRYANIVFDVGGAGYACESSAHPNGCTKHYDTTSNNVLTADSGILYLTLEFAFNSSTSWVEIGGVRLTLEHD